MTRLLWNLSFPKIACIPQHKRMLVLLAVVGTCGSGRALSISPTVTTLTVGLRGTSVATVQAGDAVTLSATVNAGLAPVTTGQVYFCDAAAVFCSDTHLLGVAQLTASGTGLLTVIPRIGIHRYKALFLGTSTAAPSVSSNMELAVDGTYASQTALTEAKGLTPYSLSAIVTGLGERSSPTPAGNVSFVDTTNSNYVLATASLAAGSFGYDFITSSTPALGSKSVPFAIVSGDFNGDGRMDLAIATGGLGTVSILIGNGDGTFTSAAPVVVKSPVALSAGDFNEDGVIDLAVLDYGDMSVVVLLGNGDGTFRDASRFPTSRQPYSIAVGDFNKDGHADLAVTSSKDNTVTVLLGNGDGTFGSTKSVATGAFPSSVVVADFNGDGNQDLAVSNANDSNLTVLLGNGDGTFHPAPSPSAGQVPFSLTAGDFNGDGRPDLAAVNNADRTVTVLLGLGDGTFRPMPLLRTGISPAYASVGDFNGDGNVDLCVTNNGDNTLTVLLGVGDGTFDKGPQPSTEGYPMAVATGDFNRDGMTDVAVANYSSGTVTVLLPQYTASASAAAVGLALIGTGLHQVVARYSGDPTYSGSISGDIDLLAYPASTTLTLSANPIGSVYGEQVLISASLDPYTAPEHTSDGEAVTFYNAGNIVGVGTLSGGQATLNVTTLPKGYNRLSARYGGDNSLASATSGLLVFPVSISPTISFTVPTHIYGDAPFLLKATSTSPGAIIYSVISGPATISGATLTLTGVGTVVVSASQLATGGYDPANQQTSFVVHSKATALVVLTPPASPILFQNTVTLTASASSSLSMPTGTMVFYDGGVAVGSVTLMNGLATLPITTLAVGSHRMSVVYSGDQTFYDQTSLPVTVVIQDFTLNLSPEDPDAAAQTIVVGNNASYAFVISPVNGATIPASVSFNLLGLPAGTTATITPATLPTGSATTNVMVLISATSQFVKLEPVGVPNRGPTIIYLSILLIPFAKRRNHLNSHCARLACIALLTIIAGGISGCGSGRTRQSFTLTFSGTAGALSRTANVVLTIH